MCVLVCACVCACVCLCLSACLTHSHTHTLTHSHSYSLLVSLTHTHSHALTLTLSVTRTHTHTLLCVFLLQVSAMRQFLAVAVIEGTYLGSPDFFKECQARQDPQSYTSRDSILQACCSPTHPRWREHLKSHLDK